VVDLGVDVPPAKFVEAIAKHKPRVVGMSVLLTTCFKSVIATVEAIKAAGQRPNVSIMVGGAAASDLLRQNAGCDFYGQSAVDGVKFADSTVGAT
jgi:methanogenic corrinoid protein MtbC1